MHIFSQLGVQYCHSDSLNSAMVSRNTYTREFGKQYKSGLYLLPLLPSHQFMGIPLSAFPGAQEPDLRSARRAGTQQHGRWERSAGCPRSSPEPSQSHSAGVTSDALPLSCFVLPLLQRQWCLPPSPSPVLTANPFCLG